MTQWIEDPSLEAPDGHQWVKPAPDGCPGCGCCTRALCEKAVRNVMECATYLGEADAETRARVLKCPCDHAPGTPLAQIYAMGVLVADGAMTDADYKAAVAQIHAGHPLEDS